VFFAAGAALLDAAECHEAEQNDEDADGPCNDADLGALRESGPTVANARGFLNFFEDFGLAAPKSGSDIVWVGEKSKKLT
jgi:hypothetical protein